MGIRDVIAGDLTNDEIIICNDEDVVEQLQYLDGMNQPDIFFQMCIRSLPLANAQSSVNKKNLLVLKKGHKSEV